MSKPAVGVVILAYGREPLLETVIDSVAASTGVDVELVVVDNGYTGEDEAALRTRRLRWLAPGRNTGFTGGCNLGAAEVDASFVAFLNSDAVVDPAALSLLVGALADPRVGIATAQVLLLEEPDTINSAGNPVHYSLLSWAGGWGDSAAAHALATYPASASGCLMMMRRELFEDLGGFHTELFAYGEDVDLSLRVWQAGHQVKYVPEARVWHKYEFSRNPKKYFLLERNRWINLLTLYEAATLLKLGPGLVVVEAGIWLSAARGGWIRQKADSWKWLIAHRGEVRARRRRVQTRRTVRDRDIIPLLRARVEPSARSGEVVPGAVNAVIAAFGRPWGVGKA